MECAHRCTCRTDCAAAVCTAWRLLLAAWPVKACAGQAVHTVCRWVWSPTTPSPLCEEHDSVCITIEAGTRCACWHLLHACMQGKAHQSTHTGQQKGGPRRDKEAHAHAAATAHTLHALRSAALSTMTALNTVCSSGTCTKTHSEWSDVLNPGQAAKQGTTHLLGTSAPSAHSQHHTGGSAAPPQCCAAPGPAPAAAAAAPSAAA